MPVRLVHLPQGNNTGELTDPLVEEIEYKGNHYTLGPNQKIVIGDDGEAVGLDTFNARVKEDNELNTKSPAETAPSRS